MKHLRHRVYLVFILSLVAGCVARSPNLDSSFGSALEGAKDRQRLPVYSPTGPGAPTSKEMDIRTQSYLKGQDSEPAGSQVGGASTGVDSRSTGQKK